MPASLETVLQDALGSQYRLERELEAGGMSRLFLATDLRLKREVVVKVLPPDLVSVASTARFKREIELTVRLQHPHILPILTSGEFEDGLFYITPYIHGESLRVRLEREGKLPLDDILRILKDVSGALAFAHQRGVVHRDIKPGNILLSDGQAILADFGIARAVSTTATPLTESGVAPGTPAYMAPELPTDERADVYALGVVAYEMLTGNLPSRGAPVVREILQARGRMSTDRPGRLRALASTIVRATTPDTTRRARSANELRQQLEAAQSARGHRSRILFAGVTLVIASALVVWRNLAQRLQMDDLTFAVVALGAEDSLRTTILDEFDDELREWIGVKVVDRSLLSTRLPRLSTSAVDIRHAMSITGANGARNLLVLETERHADSTDIHGSLYDVAGDSLARGTRLRFGTRGGRISLMDVRRLVNVLLRGESELPWNSEEDKHRPVLLAWQAYDRGRQALDHWNLADAESAFEDAIAREPELAAAHLWLAQSLVWKQTVPQPEARVEASRAIDLLPALTLADSIHASALLALTSGQELLACNEFGRLVSRDSTNLAGWLGLGDCNAHDHAVVRNPRSITGWSFESSYEAAARAYQRSADIGPSKLQSSFQGWLLGRLSGVLYSTPNHARLGRVRGADSLRFAALPYLKSDTIAFSPYSMVEFASGVHDPAPSDVQAAVVRNRELLLRSAEQWVRQAPASAAAYDSLSGWLEVANTPRRVGAERLSALEATRRAWTLTRDSAERIRLAIQDVRLLVKDSQFQAAAREADSLIRRTRESQLHAVRGSAGLSALIGRVNEAANELALNAGDEGMLLPAAGPVSIPTQLSQSAARLLVFGAFGMPQDSVRASAERTLALIESYFPDSAIADQMRGALVAYPLSLSYPYGIDILRRLPQQQDETGRAYAMLARGDTAGVRQQLVAVRQMNIGRQTGTAMDRTLRRARLALMVGDTTYALQEIDPVLQALPTLGPSLIEQVPQVTSLVRALALRAELASRRAEDSWARRCANAVLELWARPDSDLTPIVLRMKELAR